MRPSFIYRAAQARQPMIKFLGKRSVPKSIDHTPQPHPASPTHQLPESFASYRTRAQQHGPLNGGPTPTPNSQVSGGVQTLAAPASLAYGAIGGTAGKNLGSIQPKDGEFFDISELPSRFQKRPWTEDEIDAVTSGGAAMW